MTIKIRLMTLALAGTTLAPLAAQAQTQTQAQPQAAAPAAVGEIVVTAQKRSERLVNVPVSVTAVTGKTLDNSGVTNMGDLAQVVPGLHMDSSGSFSQPSIRGVGTAIAGPGANSNVPTYVDGFYRPNSLSNDFDFIDVDSVQVLKGPQGTLFGRNATGGAILVTTRSPSFTPRLDADVGYGSFGETKGSLYASSGITDQLAGSIAIFGRHTDGFITNIDTGRKADAGGDAAAHAKLLYTPATGIKFTLAVDHAQQDDPTANAVSPYKGYSTGALFGVPVELPRGKVDNNAETTHRAITDGVSLKSEFDLGFATLTSYSNARRDTGYEAIDLDASSAPLAAAHWNIKDQNWSQEFNLGSSGKGPLDWVTGLYYYHDREEFPGFYVSQINATYTGPGPFVDQWDAGQSSDSYAGFADATYNLGQWHLTLGARYGIDRAAVFYKNIVAGDTGFTTATKTWDSFTPRAVLRYQVTHDSNVYVSWSEGTKSGLFNPSGLSTTPVNPEKLTAVEVGYKISEPDWQLEASAFHYDYTNLQVASYVGAHAIIQNAANSEIYGAEAHFARHLTENLKLDIGGAYTHARYLSFPAATVYSYSPLAGVVVGSENVSGDVMQRSPEFSGTVALNYDHPLWGGSFDLGGNYSYQTKVYFDVNQGANQPAYGVLNLRAAWTDPSRHWTFALSGRNVTDQKYLVQVLEQAAEFGQVYGQPASVFFEISLHY